MRGTDTYGGNPQMVKLAGTFSNAAGTSFNLSESITNFSQLLFMFGTPSSTTTGWETVSAYPWQMGSFQVSQPKIGLTVNGAPAIITIDSTTQLTYTTGSVPLRAVYGIRKAG